MKDKDIKNRLSEETMLLPYSDQLEDRIMQFLAEREGLKALYAKWAKAVRLVAFGLLAVSILGAIYLIWREGYLVSVWLVIQNPELVISQHSYILSEMLILIKALLTDGVIVGSVILSLLILGITQKMDKILIDKNYGG